MCTRVLQDGKARKVRNQAKRTSCYIYALTDKQAQEGNMNANGMAGERKRRGTEGRGGAASKAQQQNTNAKRNMRCVNTLTRRTKEGRLHKEPERKRVQVESPFPTMSLSKRRNRGSSAGTPRCFSSLRSISLIVSFPLALCCIYQRKSLKMFVMLA